MPAMPRNPGERPVVVWLGRPLPAASRARLAAFVDLTNGWHPNASLIAVWAAEGPGVMRRLPAEARGLSVIAAADREPSDAERREWRQVGVQDIVTVPFLHTAIADRLRRISQAPRAVTRKSERVRQPRAAPVEAAPPRRNSRDDFPALLVPRPPDGIPAEVRTWIDQLGPYLTMRDSLLGGWSNGVLERYLELTHRRSMVSPRTEDDPPPDTLGEVHGTRSKSVAWPALIRRGPARGRAGIEVAEARIVGAGTDGLTLDVPFGANPRQKLVMDLAVDAETNAQLLLQARWQRRTGTERWILGVLILEMRLREVPTVAL